MSGNQLLIYKSSAGSGKTYTLVLEYLKLVLRKPALYRSILAITFTNKATAEMKNRIVNALVSLAANKDEKLRNTLISKTGLAEAVISEQAAKVLDYILHDYSGFSISTIDSFFSKIVRALARELHLPLRFDFELDSGAVTREITNMLLDDISKNDWLKKWLRDYVFEKLDNDKGWKIEFDLHKIAHQLFDERFRQLFPEPAAKPVTTLIPELQKIKSSFENRMVAFVSEFKSVLEKNGLNIADLSYGKSGAAGYFEGIINKQGWEKYKPGPRFMSAMENAKGWYSKSSPVISQITDIAERELIPLLSRIYKFYEEEFPIYTSAVSVLSTAYLAGITGALDEKLKNFRDENKIMLLSDNNLLLSKAISGQDAPFIYEKSGNKYSHFMLDEFQDTSDFQWTNLLPLIENSLGTGQYTMIVGDAKQSIYRWRGGNMQLLLDGVEDNLKHFRSITDIKNLGTNWRSRERIIHFNNRFFEIAPGLAGFPAKEIAEKAFSSLEVKQEWTKGINGEGYVKINFFEDEKEAVDTESGEMSEGNKWKLKASNETLATIHELLASGFEAGDIAILTRTNSDAKEITGYLLENGITRIISPESMLLIRSPKILFLINVLTFIDDYDNDLALAHMAYQWELVRAQNKEEGYHRIFSIAKNDKLISLPESFKNRITEFRKLPLYELVEELTALFKLNITADAYIQRFLDIIIEYTRNNPPGIADFLTWWEENQEKDTTSVIIPSDENAIRVMSIHKSKGLQFPVVIMPFADWQLTPKPTSMIWVESDVPPFNLTPAHPVTTGKILQHSIFADAYKKEVDLTYMDNLNVLYVAFTRAEERLYIFTKQQGERKDPEIKSAGQLILDTLLNVEEWKDKFLSHQFEIGILQSHVSRKESNSSQVILDQWISESWKERLKMGISKNKISAADPEPPETHYGNLFHAIAAEINTAGDFQNLIEKHAVDANEEIKFRLNKELEMFVKLGSERGWFEKDLEILSEAELLLEDGTVLRPDRLLLKDKSAIVIDYKTGKAEPFHADQVREYAAALSKMNYEMIKIYLVYPAEEKALEIM